MLASKDIAREHNRTKTFFPRVGSWSALGDAVGGVDVFSDAESVADGGDAKGSGASLAVYDPHDDYLSFGSNDDDQAALADDENAAFRTELESEIARLSADADAILELAMLIDAENNNNGGGDDGGSVAGSSVASSLASVFSSSAVSRGSALPARTAAAEEEDLQMSDDEDDDGESIASLADELQRAQDRIAANPESLGREIATLAMGPEWTEAVRQKNAPPPQLEQEDEDQVFVREEDDKDDEVAPLPQEPEPVAAASPAPAVAEPEPEPAATAPAPAFVVVAETKEPAVEPEPVAVDEPADPVVAQKDDKEEVEEKEEPVAVAELGAPIVAREDEKEQVTTTQETNIEEEPLAAEQVFEDKVAVADDAPEEEEEMEEEPVVYATTRELVIEPAVAAVAPSFDHVATEEAEPATPENKTVIETVASDTEVRKEEEVVALQEKSAPIGAEPTPAAAPVEASTNTSKGLFQWLFNNKVEQPQNEEEEKKAETTTAVEEEKDAVSTGQDVAMAVAASVAAPATTEEEQEPGVAKPIADNEQVTTETEEPVKVEEKEAKQVVAKTPVVEAAAVSAAAPKEEKVSDENAPPSKETTKKNRLASKKATASADNKPPGVDILMRLAQQAKSIDLDKGLFGKDVRFIKLPNNGGKAVLFTGAVGEASRSVRTTQPLAKPQALTSRQVKKMTKKKRAWKKVLGIGRRRKSQSKASKVSSYESTLTTWRPFLVPFFMPGGNLTFTPRVVSYFEVQFFKAPLKSAQAEEEKQSEHGNENPAAEAPKKAECVSVGLTLDGFDLQTYMPGWTSKSFGYHGDDGTVFGAGVGQRGFGPAFGVGDVIGCGVDYRIGRVFYTYNGRFLGYDGVAMSLDQLDSRNFYPTIGLDARVCAKCNLGLDKPFAFDLPTMMNEKPVFAIAKPPLESAPPVIAEDPMNEDDPLEF